MNDRRIAARLALALALLLPVAAGLFKVWVHHDAVQLGYRLSEREEQRKLLRNQAQQLEIELAAEQTPARLNQLAHELSMTPPALGRVSGAGRPVAQTNKADKTSKLAPAPAPRASAPPAAASQGGAYGRP